MDPVEIIEFYFVKFHFSVLSVSQFTFHNVPVISLFVICHLALLLKKKNEMFEISNFL